MNRLPAFRYYLVFIARWTAGVFLPGTIFITFAFGLVNWREILGLGITGLSALIWFVMIGRKWERDGLVVAPNFNLDNYLFGVTSVVFALSFIFAGIYTVISNENRIFIKTLHSYYFEILLGFFVLIFFVFSIFRLVRMRHLGTPCFIRIPFYINLFSIIFVILLHLGDSQMDIGMRIRSNGYQAIVRQVTAHKITPDERGSAKLPWNYAFLSNGGEIIIAEKPNSIIVKFISFRGYHGDFIGICYQSDTNQLSTTNEGDLILSTEVKGMDENWYVCASDQVQLRETP